MYEKEQLERFQSNKAAQIVNGLTRSRGYNDIMLNSAEHEILSAHTINVARNSKLFMLR